MTLKVYLLSELVAKLFLLKGCVIVPTFGYEFLNMHWNVCSSLCVWCLNHVSCSRLFLYPVASHILWQYTCDALWYMWMLSAHFSVADKSSHWSMSFYVILLCTKVRSHHVFNMSVYVWFSPSFRHFATLWQDWSDKWSRFPVVQSAVFKVLFPGDVVEGAGLYARPLSSQAFHLTTMWYCVDRWNARRIESSSAVKWWL